MLLAIRYFAILYDFLQSFFIITFVQLNLTNYMNFITAPINELNGGFKSNLIRVSVTLSKKKMTKYFCRNGLCFHLRTVLF